MTNSVSVFDPGFRLTDNVTGAVVPGGTLYFYDAGTTNPKSVYSDKDLSVTLGTSVVTDAMGAPTSDGSTKTIIYVDTSPYKVTAKDASGNTIWTHDNQKGAVAITTPSDLSIVATTPVITKSLDYTVLPADQSTEFVGNCSSADVTFTLPSAVTVGSGWFVTIQHAGSANQVLIATTSSQTIASGALSYGTTMVLARSGESVKLTSDGGNWRVSHHTSPHIKGGFPIVAVEDRLTAPPGSEVNGAFYLISGTPSGGWTAFADNDLVQFTLGAWVRFSPLEGMIAWVKDEDKTYRYSGSAWVVESATTAAAGTVQLADKSATVSRTSGRAMTPDQARFEPSATKCWINFSGSGTVAVNDDDGFSSASDFALGTWGATMDTAMANTVYSTVFGGGGLNNAVTCGSGNFNTTTFIYVKGFDYNSGNNADFPRVCISVAGQQ